jgi:2-methylcitrate dehydratase PrpD
VRLYDVDRSTAPIHNAVADLSGKVEVMADVGLEEFYPRHWPAEVEIKIDGDVFHHRVITALGDPERPLGRDEFNEKAHRVLDSLLGAARVDEWLVMCHAAFGGRAGCERLATAFASLDSIAAKA